MHHRLQKKPLLYEAVNAHRDNKICFLPNGEALVNLGKYVQTVPRSHQFDLTAATMFGLNERLTADATSPRLAGGLTLRELFNAEWELYSQALIQAENGLNNYGWYAYYHERNHLVRYAPPFWHEVVSVASSSKLLADQERALTWRQIRDVLRSTVVAVAGASVGSGIAHAVMLDIRPVAIKIAVKSVYKLENINRVRLSYADMVLSEEQRVSVYDVGLKNKAETFAEQVYSIDPFTNVFTYPEGITVASINEFFAGSDGEPPASIILEEIDDPRTKILLREEARRRKIPLLMMTDIGSSVQFDLMRYDQDQSLPLAWGVSDSDVYAAMQRVYDEPGDRKVFFSFVDSLIGTAYRRDELGEIIAGTCEIPTSTIIPQLGSTALVAAGFAAEAIARLRLGYEYPRRCLVNKRTLEVVHCDGI